MPDQEREIPADLQEKAWHYLCDFNEDCGQCDTICELAQGCTCFNRLYALLLAERERAARIAESLSDDWIGENGGAACVAVAAAIRDHSGREK